MLIWSEITYGRKQYVLINNQKSASKSTNIGLPQGSILGPLLFILCINDLVNSSSLLQKVLFADDTNLFLSNSDLSKLQEILNKELASVDTWFKCNRLSLNVSKTNYIVFHSSRSTLNTDQVCLKIDKEEITKVKETRFLGVMIDECLDFKCHINVLMTKLSKYVGLFYKIRHVLPFSALLTLYKCLFEPHLNYCNEIWCNTFPSHLSKIEVLQKKVIRAICWADFNAPTDPLFHTHGLLKLNELNLYHNACTMYQVVNNINQRLCDLIPIYLPQHAYPTRKKHHITGKKRSLTCTRLSIAYRGPQIWNDLEGFIKKSQSIHAFKKNMKRKLLLTYVQCCQ